MNPWKDGPPWKRGFGDFWDAVPITENPYPPDTDAARVWEDGWLAGKNEYDSPAPPSQLDS